MEKGLIHVYYGDGKGKTTAAFGQALRAAGHGLKVAVIQFFKSGGFSGEILAARRLSPLLSIWQFGKKCPHAAKIQQKIRECRRCKECFIDRSNPKDRAKEKIIAAEAWKKAKEVINSMRYDLVILDEISIAIGHHLLNQHEVLEVLAERPPTVEIILTGSRFPASIIEKADYVSEIKLLKHPYQRLVRARRGIEY